MESSGTKLTDLKAAILREPEFYQIMTEDMESDCPHLHQYIHRTVAVRDEMAEWLVNLVDPERVKSVAQHAMLVGTLRIRLARAMTALTVGIADDKTIIDLM